MAASAWPGARGLAGVAAVGLLLAAPACYQPVWPPAAPAPAPPQALTEATPPDSTTSTRPPPGHLPAGLLALSRHSRHVIAVDAARSRLYLLERDGSTWRPVAEHPVSLGKAGVDKFREGDARTPLGVYQITSRLDRPALDPFYGDGALTLDYPNALDRNQGRAGSRIWIHGSPRDDVLRPPRDTDGCVVLPNAALRDLMARVATHTTPVLIAADLTWQAPDELATRREHFETAWRGWQHARRAGAEADYAAFYIPGVRPAPRGARLEYKDLTLLAWPDGQPVLQATFGEVPVGQRAGVTRRQHWRLEQGQWRIFDESMLR